MSDLRLRRWLYLGLVIATTIPALEREFAVLRVDGLTALEFVLLALFTLLFAWIASSFWLASIGAYLRWRRIDCAGFLHKHDTVKASSSRTAIVMPLYNECTERVFAGLAAIRESIADAGGRSFEFFILSDSTNRETVAAEIRAVQHLRSTSPEGAQIYYRHRERNIGRKSGNIQDFCENWGALYDYMVVLDADSLMTGKALMQLARWMDDNPRTALIQVPPQLLGRESLFGRMQQFASSVYGPCFAAGLAYLQGNDGNYWGHNAIIRVRAFMRHCGLPKLPGRAPFGGEILSHDFVEAALLRRAGWDVWMAPELGGSFEEPPPTIIDHLKRDRRWCQGNLQHMRLLLAVGLKLPSRLHMALGVMNYLASPLWLLLLIMSAVEMYSFSAIEPFTYVGRYPVLSSPISHTAELLLLLLVTIVLLFGPKLLALGVLLRDEQETRAHGGRWAAVRSVFLECLFSTLFAPVVMLSHSGFVMSILFLGRASGWGTQQRTDRALPLGVAVKLFALHTAVGLAAAFVLYWFVPDSLGWFVPLLIGLLLAIPLVYITSSVQLGIYTRERGLFRTPAEMGAVGIANRVQELAPAAAG